MSEKKKPSGAFYRKRKANLERDAEKQAKAMRQFVSRSEPSCSGSGTSGAESSVETEGVEKPLLVSKYFCKI